MSRKSALLALMALPLAAALNAQELSDEQRAEIAARIAPIGDVCLQGENCGGVPTSPASSSGGGSMASAPASKSAAPSASDSSADTGDEEMEVSMASGEEAAEGGEAAASAGAQTAGIDGEAIYNQACVACHASGVGGAPVVGDIDSWSPRIAKGIEALHNSGVNGVAGTAMMAKGGRADLSDQQVMAAVDYMVEASQ